MLKGLLAGITVLVGVYLHHYLSTKEMREIEKKYVPELFPTNTPVTYIQPKDFAFLAKYSKSFRFTDRQTMNFVSDMHTIKKEGNIVHLISYNNSMDFGLTVNGDISKFIPIREY
jgi:hypothetical protein